MGNFVSGEAQFRCLRRFRTEFCPTTPALTSLPEPTHTVRPRGSRLCQPFLLTSLLLLWLRRPKSRGASPSGCWIHPLEQFFPPDRLRMKLPRRYLRYLQAPSPWPSAGPSYHGLPRPVCCGQRAECVVKYRCSSLSFSGCSVRACPGMALRVCFPQGGSAGPARHLSVLAGLRGVSCTQVPALSASPCTPSRLSGFFSIAVLGCARREV